MAPDVIHGTNQGVDSLLGYWKIFSLFFDDIDIQAVYLKRGAKGSLLATTEATLTVTPSTLRYAFPHLLQADKGEEWTPLAAKLLGQQLILRGFIYFGWDAEHHHVVHLQQEFDLLTPLLRLLGNLEDVSWVFSNAFITPTFGLLETTYFPK